METLLSAKNKVNNIIGTKIETKLEDLKIKRDKLIQEIEEGYQKKEQIQNQLDLYGQQMQNLADNLEQKHILLDSYDKILSQSDLAYSKIVESTQALYNRIKNEEKKFGNKNNE